MVDKDIEMMSDVYLYFFHKSKNPKTKIIKEMLYFERAYIITSGADTGKK